MSHVKLHFRPEFINRVDDFITFDPLRPEQIRQIVLLRALKFADRLAGGWVGGRGPAPAPGTGACAPAWASCAAVGALSAVQGRRARARPCRSLR
jgi:hypothetical protein